MEFNYRVPPPNPVVDRLIYDEDDDIPTPPFDSYLAGAKRGSQGKATPDFVVVHAMAEYIDIGPTPLHATEYLERVEESAHMLITPSGVPIRMVPETNVAWHCRAQRMNWRALGIEFLVPGVHDYGSFLRALKTNWWESTQLTAGAAVIASWMVEFGIPFENVKRHFSLDSRKEDPGALPWDVLKGRIGEELASVSG